MTEGSRELDRTPTWAVASVCGVIILISILMEKGLHHLGEYFTARRKKAMYEALEKIKAELMILGFISLLLTFGQNYIIRICIPEKAADTMLPCHLEEEEEPVEHVQVEKQHRTLLWDSFVRNLPRNRMLSEASSSPQCHHGKIPLISLHGLHQLHIFIFFLAVFHVFYSALTMALGREKIRSWREWEKATSSPDYNFSHDPAKFRFSHETSFVKQHSSIWNSNPVLFYVGSFFRQFFRSVRQADYLAMRHGFITVHLAPGSQFDFQKYIKRSLEDDFKVIVGISPILWASAVLVLLLNVKGWLTLFWISVIPLVMILSVGTKLQAIITQMALEIQEKHAVIQGIPLVQLSDQHFWFGRPKFVLFLIHFTLFQNAFQLIFIIWIWYEFGWHSCFQDEDKLMIARIFLGISVQILCSYITLPLYALVSQMGSHMKKSIFDDQTSRAIMKWHHNVMKKKTPESPKPGAAPPPDHDLRPTGDVQRTPRQDDQDKNSFDTKVQVSAATASQIEDGSTQQHGTEQEKEADDGFQSVDI